MKYMTLFQRMRFVGVVFACICIAGLGVSTWSSSIRSLQSKGKAPQVTNKTQALQVAGVKVTDGELYISLRNGYSKNITSFEVSVGGGTTIQTEFIYNDEVIAPGHIYQEKYDVNSNLLTEGLTILAVVFEDGTGDGDPKVVQEIEEIRLGERMQLEHIIPLIQKALSMPDTDSSVLDKLESEISALPDGRDSKLPEYVKSGLQNKKGHLLQEIQQLKQEQRVTGSSKVKEKLTKIRDRQKKLAAKLSIS